MADTPNKQGKEAVDNKDIDKKALFLLNVILTNKAKIEPDWAVVATNMGLANAASASTRFGQIKRELMAKAGYAAEVPQTPTKKRKVANGDENTTPAKKARKKSAKAESERDGSVRASSPVTKEELDAAVAEFNTAGFKDIESDHNIKQEMSETTRIDDDVE